MYLQFYSVRRTHAVALVTLLAFAGLAVDTTRGQTTRPPAETNVTGDSYPLNTCAVSGKVLPENVDEQIIYNHEGREIRFCCKGCIKKFQEDSAGYLAIIDNQIAEQQKVWYPLKTCVVSGGELGGMGDPIEYIHNNRLIRFCCKGCIGKFEKDAANYLKKLDAAVIEQQRADYSRGTCLVSGQKLGAMGDPAEIVVANRLVRLCCAGCIKKVRKEPARFLAMLTKSSHDQQGADGDQSTAGEAAGPSCCGG